VHRDTERTGVLGDSSVAVNMRANLSCVGREQIAVDVGGLRDSSHADEKHANECGKAQPKRLRPGARHALAHPLHATLSMTCFRVRRTQRVVNR